MKKLFTNFISAIILIASHAYAEDIPVGHLVDFTGAT